VSGVRRAGKLFDVILLTGYHEEHTDGRVLDFWNVNWLACWFDITKIMFGAVVQQINKEQVIGIGIKI
jgi:hypothetical protein